MLVVTSPILPSILRGVLVCVVLAAVLCCTLLPVASALDAAPVTAPAAAPAALSPELDMLARAKDNAVVARLASFEDGSEEKLHKQLSSYAAKAAIRAGKKAHKHEKLAQKASKLARIAELTMARKLRLAQDAAIEQAAADAAAAAARAALPAALTAPQTGPAPIAAVAGPVAAAKAAVKKMQATFSNVAGVISNSIKATATAVKTAAVNTANTLPVTSAVASKATKTSFLEMSNDMPVEAIRQELMKAQADVKADSLAKQRAKAGPVGRAPTAPKPKTAVEIRSKNAADAKQTDSRAQLAWWAYVLIVAGTIMFVTALYFIYRHYTLKADVERAYQDMKASEV